MIGIVTTHPGDGPEILREKYRATDPIMGIERQQNMNVERMWNTSSVEGRNALLKRFGLHYKYDACEGPFQVLGFGMQLDILHTASVVLGK